MHPPQPAIHGPWIRRQIARNFLIEDITLADLYFATGKPQKIR
jgi:hypothetical protein